MPLPNTRKRTRERRQQIERRIQRPRLAKLRPLSKMPLTVPPMPVCGLVLLPIEIVQHVMSKLSCAKLKLLRRSSLRLRATHNAYMEHYHKKFAYQQSRKGTEDGNCMCIMLQVLTLGTDYYVRSGYYDQYNDTLLPFHTQMEIMELSSFLRHFYDIIEGPPTSTKKLKQRRLVYILTMFNILRQFQTFTVVSNELQFGHWHLQIMVWGAYVGKVHHEGGNSCIVEHNMRIDYLAILNELLQSDLLRKNLCRFLEIRDSVYVYGFDQKLRKRRPRLVLAFTIVASQCILDLMQEVLDGRFEPDVPVPEVPDEPFGAHLEVTCKHARTWVGNTEMSIPILPIPLSPFGGM